MALKLIPPGQGSKLREYYIRFEGSMYGVLHVDNTAHTVDLVHLRELDNIPVFVESLDPYKLCGVRVFDSSSFRMVLCFFDRFYVTAGDMHVLEFDSSADYMAEMRVSLYLSNVFSSLMEGQDSNPWRTIRGDTDGAWVCEFAPTEEGLRSVRGRESLRHTCIVRTEVDGSLTLWSTSRFTSVGQWGTNNFSTGEWRLVDARRPRSMQGTI